MATKNLLLGGGEKLAGRATIVRGGGPKKRPYTLAEVRAELLAPVQEIAEACAVSPSRAKPRGEGVFEMTLHLIPLPETTTQPNCSQPLASVTLAARKRRSFQGRPQKIDWKASRTRRASLLIAGREDGINRLASFLTAATVPEYIGQQLAEIESVRWLGSEEKVRPSSDR